MEPEQLALGRVAYQAYGNARNWTAVNGGAIPHWANQAPDLQEAWTHAAEAVVTAYTADAATTGGEVSGDASTGSGNGGT
jgi:hypothetical protein